MNEFRYREGRIIYGRYLDFKIVRISIYRAFDYEVKLLYDSKRHPPGAQKLNYSFAQISEEYLYREEMANAALNKVVE